MTGRLSRFWLALLVIVIAGFGLRITSLVLWSPDTTSELGGDAVYYHEAANLLADGKGFIDPYRYIYGSTEQVLLEDGRTVEVITPVGHEEPTAGHPPVYVLFLGFVSTLGFRSILAHQVASILLGSASIVVAALLDRRWRNERVGLIAA